MRHHLLLLADDSAFAPEVPVREPELRFAASPSPCFESLLSLLLELLLSVVEFSVVAGVVCVGDALADDEALEDAEAEGEAEGEALCVGVVVFC